MATNRTVTVQLIVQRIILSIILLAAATGGAIMFFDAKQPHVRIQCALLTIGMAAIFIWMWASILLEIRRDKRKRSAAIR